MEISIAKQLVVRAGKELVDSGLIARTWGNVSCRVDERTFAITPSGRSYETLQPEEIVICLIEDTSYDGDIKPSSEKGIHALIYKTYPEINFVIHTHQPMASVISSANISSMPLENYKLLRDKVPIAAYGLPGTKGLKENIGRALSDKSSKAVIMAHHGALCFGKDYEETFAVAKQLEEACQEHLKKEYIRVSGRENYNEKEYYRYYISSVTGMATEHSFSPISLCKSRRTAEGFLYEGETQNVYQYHDPMPPEAIIHSMIYQKRKDVNFISQNNEKGLLEISLSKVTLKPLLDDFAQIVGGTAQCSKSNKPEDIIKALRKHMGVLVPGYGAICLAKTESDLHAVQLVMEKNALAQIGTQLIGGGKPLSFFDCQLMHLVYTRSYAKKASVDKQ